MLEPNRCLRKQIASNEGREKGFPSSLEGEENTMGKERVDHREEALFLCPQLYIPRKAAAYLSLFKCACAELLFLARRTVAFPPGNTDKKGVEA